MGSTCSPTQPTWETSGLHPLPWVMALPVAKNPERCCRRNDYALAGSRRGKKNCNQILGGKSFFCLLLSRKNPIQYHLGFIGNTVNHGETPIKWCRISDINSRIWDGVYRWILRYSPVFGRKRPFLCPQNSKTLPWRSSTSCMTRNQP